MCYEKAASAGTGYCRDYKREGATYSRDLQQAILSNLHQPAYKIAYAKMLQLGTFEVEQNYIQAQSLYRELNIPQDDLLEGLHIFSTDATSHVTNYMPQTVFHNLQFPPSQEQSVSWSAQGLTFEFLGNGDLKVTNDIEQHSLNPNMAEDALTIENPFGRVILANDFFKTSTLHVSAKNVLLKLGHYAVESMEVNACGAKNKPGTLTVLKGAKVKTSALSQTAGRLVNKGLIYSELDLTLSLVGGGENVSSALKDENQPFGIIANNQLTLSSDVPFMNKSVLKAGEKINTVGKFENYTTVSTPHFSHEGKSLYNKGFIHVQDLTLLCDFVKNQGTLYGQQCNVVIKELFNYSKMGLMKGENIQIHGFCNKENATFETPTGFSTRPEDTHLIVVKNLTNTGIIFSKESLTLKEMKYSEVRSLNKDLPAWITNPLGQIQVQHNLCIEYVNKFDFAFLNWNLPLWQLNPEHCGTLILKSQHFETVADLHLGYHLSLDVGQFINTHQWQAPLMHINAKTFKNGTGSKRGSLFAGYGMEIKVEGDVDNKNGIICVGKDLERVQDGALAALEYMPLYDGDEALMIASENGDVHIGSAIKSKRRTQYGNKLYDFYEPNGSYIRAAGAITLKGRNINVECGKIFSADTLDLYAHETIDVRRGYLGSINKMRLFGQKAYIGIKGVLEHTSRGVDIYKRRLCSSSGMEIKVRTEAHYSHVETLNLSDKALVQCGADIELNVAKLDLNSSVLQAVGSIYDKDGRARTTQEHGPRFTLTDGYFSCVKYCPVYGEVVCGEPIKMPAQILAGENVIFDIDDMKMQGIIAAGELVAVRTKKFYAGAQDFFTSPHEAITDGSSTGFSRVTPLFTLPDAKNYKDLVFKMMMENSIAEARPYFEPYQRPLKGDAIPREIAPSDDIFFKNFFYKMAQKTVKAYKKTPILALENKVEEETDLTLINEEDNEPYSEVALAALVKECSFYNEPISKKESITKDKKKAAFMISGGHFNLDVADTSTLRTILIDADKDTNVKLGNVNAQGSRLRETIPDGFQDMLNPTEIGSQEKLNYEAENEYM